jgi:hypothetical protein
MYNDAMHRTTIMADAPTIDRLRELAHNRGVSLAEVIREALEEKAGSYLPKPASLGAGQSTDSGTAAGPASQRVPPRSWR